MTDTHIHWHRHERKYADLDPSLIPTTESLQDTIDRYIMLVRTCSLDAVWGMSCSYLDAQQI